MIRLLFAYWQRFAVCALLLMVAVPVLAATEDALGPILRGEFALQSGDTDRAEHSYLDAARNSDDPALARRAAEIALLAHDYVLAEQGLQRWRQLDPQSPDLACDAALLALRKGEHDIARRDLLAILVATDDGWSRAIRVLATATDSATTAAVAGDLLAQGRWPSDITAWLAFGEVAERLGDPALSKRVTAEVLRRFPQDSRPWLLESVRQREQGDTTAARQSIERALALGGSDKALRTLAAAAQAGLGDQKAAAATLAVGPQDDASYTGRAAYLAQADDDNGLAALYADVKSQPGEPDADRRLLLGQLAEYLKHGDEALAWYRGVSKGVAHDTAQNRIAIVLESRGDSAGALATLRAQQHNSRADPESQRDSFELEAEMLIRHGHKDEALAVYGRGLAFFDGDGQLLYGRALLLNDMDRVAEAEANLREIIAGDPNNAEALNALGYTLADRTQRYGEAQALIEKALSLQPDSPAFLDSLGWVQHRLGHNSEALRNLRRAFALQKDAEIAAHLGEVLWIGGDKEAARVVWKQGQAIDKDNRALARVVRTYRP